MFIRVKTINKTQYAYLVENKWRKRRKNKVKQRTLKYLGKLHKIPKFQNKILEKTEGDYKKIILTLIKTELENHNFKEIQNKVFEKDEVKVNLQKKEVINQKTKKKICLEINNNFLCTYTLRKLLNFTPKEGLTKLQIGKQLANTLESTGIQVSRETFVSIAKKILNEADS